MDSGSLSNSLLKLLLSHQIVSPRYTFEKYLDDILSGVERKFQLRSQDELQQLAELPGRLATEICKTK